MSDTGALVLKLLPAACYVVLGYGARRWLGLTQQAVARLLFLVLIPIVVFRGALFSEPARFVGIAVGGFLFCSACALAAWPWRRRFKGSASPGMVMSLFSCFNIGWFGVPVVLAVLGNDAARVMTALYVGGTVFGNTVGCVLASDTPPAPRAIARKLLAIPALYGFVLALGMHCSPEALEFMRTSPAVGGVLKTAAFMTSLCGMGLVGISIFGARLAGNATLILDLLAVRFASTATLAAAVLVVLRLAGVGSALDLQVFALLPYLPIAANLLVFKRADDDSDGFVGMTIFASTMLSFLVLPVVFALQG